MSRRAGTANGSTQEPIMDKKDGEDRMLHAVRCDETTASNSAQQ
jgi:hypothetical protein